MLKEFKSFLLKDNVLSLALAVIIGGALTKVVNALAEDLIMPIAGAAIPGGAWRDVVLALGPVRFTVGHFVGTLVDFAIVGFVVWRMSKLFIKPAAPAPATRPCPYCAMDVAPTASRCGHCTSMLADVPVPVGPLGLPAGNHAPRTLVR